MNSESYWIMDEFVSRKLPRFKQICLILFISYHLIPHFTQAAFPIERDVKKLAGVSPPKRWIVFMEKLTKVCLNDMKTDNSLGLIDILRCMTKKKNFKILHGQYSMWTTIQRYPNFLEAEGNFFYFHLQIIVHRQFNLNVTVIYYITEYEISEIDELYLSGKKYKGLLFPFTFISSSNSLKIAFPFDAEICIGIEYSICQRFNGTNYRRMETNGMYFLWGYFLVTCFRIHVDMTARLALNTASCLGCKLVVYDGPTGKSSSHPEKQWCW